MSNQSSAADRPVKRRRGRPRKDFSIYGDITPLTPASDNLKGKQSVLTSDPTSDDMIGRMVSGVIDGSFDAGYLLSVKVGDTNMHLRGVAFLPGYFTPITAENDVAPYAKMIERKEIPFSVVNTDGHPHAVSPSSGKSEKPVEHKNDPHNLPDQGLHIGLHSGATTASGSRSTSIPNPPASNLPSNDTDLSPGQKDLQEQIFDSGLQTDKAVGQDQSLPMEGPNIDVEALNASEPVSATLPATETVNLKPQVEDQTACSDLKTQELFRGDVKSPDLCDNETHKCSEPEPRGNASEPAQIDLLEKEASSRQTIDFFQDTELEVAMKNTGGADTTDMDGASTSEVATTAMTIPCSASESDPDTELELGTKNSGGADSTHMDGSSASEAATTAMSVPWSASESDLDTELELGTKISGGADMSYMDGLPASNTATTAMAVLSEPKPVAEETPPKTVVPKDSSALKAAYTNSEKSNDKDEIPPAQS